MMTDKRETKNGDAVVIIGSNAFVAPFPLLGPNRQLDNEDHCVPKIRRTLARLVPARR